MTAAQPEPLTDWFFVMTYQVSMPDGRFGTETTDGIIPLGASSARRSAYLKILATCRERDWVPAGAAFSVLFFYLEPDRLSTPAQVPEVSAP